MLDPLPLPPPNLLTVAECPEAPLLVYLLLLLSLPSVLVAPRTRSLIRPLYISESACRDSRRAKLCVSNAEVDSVRLVSSADKARRPGRGMSDIWSVRHVVHKAKNQRQ